MATTATLGSGAATQSASIRKISLHDLMDALTKGIDDFKEKPSLAPFAAGVYLLASFLALMVVANYDYLPLVFPVVSGAVLIGPFVTIALCEVSRRRERGIEYGLMSGYNFFNSPSIKDILLLGLMMVALFLFWLGTAMTIYGLTMGDEWRSVPSAPDSMTEFFKQLLFTSRGWTMIILGNLIGLFFAVVSLCVGTISFPMLLDREVGIGTAVHTSVNAVKENPVTMGMWGLIVVVLLIAGAIPFFAGLAVVVPVLGHATWHLYRKLVV
ncbi:MAG: DUF2189 domain-containing protein [Rhodospirillaceae bacterium]|nr:DUF2189 domain-containing protein [Rhodospirillaceae bacterium]